MTSSCGVLLTHIKHGSVNAIDLLPIYLVLLKEVMFVICQQIERIWHEDFFSKMDETSGLFWGCCAIPLLV